MVVLSKMSSWFAPRAGLIRFCWTHEEHTGDGVGGETPLEMSAFNLAAAALDSRLIQPIKVSIAVGGG